MIKPGTAVMIKRNKRAEKSARLTTLYISKCINNGLMNLMLVV